MPTPAQIAASIANAQSSTGPRTDEGKAVSSQNALKTGLFAATDFIRHGEESIYNELEETLERELSPVGLLERNLMDEIFSAMWRLRRCRLVEGTFAAQLAEAGAEMPDPMQSEETEKFQASVDRARNQANRLLHKNTAELRRLQTERHFRNEVLPESTSVAGLGVCDFGKVMKSAKSAFAAQRRLMLRETDEMLSAVEKEGAELAAAHSAKQTQAVPPEAAPTVAGTARNAPCPCKSGEKYKRCCGKNAPPLLQAA